MTTTAHEDQFTADTERHIAKPYDTAAILRQNVAGLERELQRQRERADRAEAELKAAREQEPVAWMLECQQWTGDTAWLLSWSKSGAGQCNRLEGESHQRALYTRPIPAPAVPYGVDEEAANRIALAVYDCKNDICPEPLLYAINRILATEAHPLSVEGRDALLQSAPQAPAVPELDPMTRLIVSDPKQPNPTALQAPAVPVYLLERQENGLSWYIGATTCFGGAWHWTADVNSAIRFSREEDAAACWNIIARHHIGIGGSGTTETTPKQHIFDVRTLLQSAEGSNAAADRLLEGGE